VYTVGNNPQDDDLPEALKDELKEAMNNGDFDDAHPEIVAITYVEPQAISNPDELNDSDPNQVRSSVSPSPNASVIIGASVGALLVLGALVFYRRRQKDDQADVTTQGGDSNLV
jgi:LPXTG-motif cell wall-anchored protein